MQHSGSREYCHTLAILNTLEILTSIYIVLKDPTGILKDRMHRVEVVLMSSVVPCKGVGTVGSGEDWKGKEDGKGCITWGSFMCCNNPPANPIPPMVPLTQRSIPRLGLSNAPLFP